MSGGYTDTSRLAKGAPSPCARTTTALLDEVAAMVRPGRVIGSARTSRLRRPIRRRMMRVASSGTHKASSEPDASSFASARASRRSVFARAWRMPVSCGLTTTTRATWGSMMRAISHAPPVTSTTTRSCGPRLPAKSSSDSGVVSIRPGGSDLPVLDDRDLTEATVNIQTDRSHLLLLLLWLLLGENRWANDSDGFVLSAPPGKSQGRPPKSRARSPSTRTGLPSLRSPRRPLSRSAERRSGPRRQPSSDIVMPRERGASARWLAAKAAPSGAAIAAGLAARPTPSARSVTVGSVVFADLAGSGALRHTREPPGARGRACRG